MKTTSLVVAGAILGLSMGLLPGCAGSAEPGAKAPEAKPAEPKPAPATAPAAAPVPAPAPVPAKPAPSAAAPATTPAPGVRSTTIAELRATPAPRPEQVVIAAEPGVAKPPFAFSAEDEALLDAVQRGAFNFLWTAVTPGSGMVVDRTSALAKNFVSNAGVGFQLSALVIGVERGWITRAQGEERALSILRTLVNNPTNRHFGMLYHYLDGTTGGQPSESWEHAVSTVDAALFYAGSLPAGMYFGGEVRQLADRLFAEADWSKFYITSLDAPMAKGRKMEPYDLNKFTLAWKPTDKLQPNGPGSFIPYFWLDSGGEHKLVAFMAASAPRPEHRVGPEAYYNLRRPVGVHTGAGGEIGPMVYLPYSGSTFIQFFAHCWIDYGAMGVDDPSRFGIARRARVDWWENSRRHTLMHRAYARENPKGLPSLGENAWGLSASDFPGGYHVPGVIPSHVRLTGEEPNFDFATEDVRTEPGDGTIAPYGAGGCIMFDPAAAVAAMRHYKSLKAEDGSPLVWRDPASGGFGFMDAYNEKGKDGKPWVGQDCLAIDQGPLILAIENARTGLIWNLFHSHPAIKDGMGRLGLSRQGRDRAK